MKQYEKMIDYLTQKDISFYKEDIKQELLFYAWQLCQKIEEKKLIPKDADSYIFISLKRENQRLNKKYKQTFTMKRLAIESFVYMNQDNHFYYSYINKIAVQRLTKFEYFVFDLYFKQGLSQKAISKKLNVSQQFIQQLIQKIIKKIKKFIF